MIEQIRFEVDVKNVMDEWTNKWKKEQPVFFFSLGCTYTHAHIQA